MTFDEAIKEIPNHKVLSKMICDNCQSNDWYCPTPCNTLRNIRYMPFDKIQKSYARNDGDLVKVCRYINRSVI